MHNNLLLAQVEGEVILKLFKEWLCLLNVHRELSKLGLYLIFILIGHATVIRHGGFFETIVQLGAGKLWQFVERFLDVEALGTCKNLELLRVNDEVMARHFSHESL